MDIDDKDTINLNEVIIFSLITVSEVVTFMKFIIDQNEENNVDDDLGLEFYDLDGSDDNASRKVKTTTPLSAILKYIDLFFPSPL